MQQKIEFSIAKSGFRLAYFKGTQPMKITFHRRTMHPILNWLRQMTQYMPFVQANTAISRLLEIGRAHV